MAIQTNYLFKGILITDAYIKINHVGINNQINGDKKIFLMTALFEVKADKENEVIHTDIINFIGDPNMLAHEQAYSELKKAFPESKNI
jgi:hypothetical protein